MPEKKYAAQERYRRKKFGWHVLPDDRPPHSGYWEVTKKLPGKEGGRYVEMMYYDGVTKTWLQSSGEIIAWKFPPLPYKERKKSK